MSHTILKAVLGTLLIIVSVLAIGGRRSTVLPGHPSQSQPGAFSTQSDGQGSLVVRADGDECQRRLQDWEREIRADGRGWRAENRKTGLTATFDRRGMEVRPATPDQDWRWGLELVSYGVGDHQVVVGDRASQVRTAGQQVSYDWDANLEEWYRNDEKGLEHGYTIRRRPDSALTPDSAPTKVGQAEGALALRLRTRGGLNVLGQVSGRELHFAEPEGDGVLTYGDLKVFDATGRELNAWFELEPEGGFQVLVEDSGATYPLTVDPHISQARGLAASRHSVALAPVPQTATKLVITTQPVAGASGANLSPQPVVQIQDVSNNVVVNSTATVAVAVVGADGVLSGTVTVPAAAGVATFTNLSLAGKVGTSYKLVFSSSGLQSIDSAALTVTAGAAAKLEITTQPVAAASGADLLPQPSVKLKDAQDNDVTTNGIVVTASIEPGTSGGQVSGNVTATTNSSGVATFTGLKLAGVIGTNYRLRFSATSLTPAVSNNLAVTGAGTATQLVVTTQPLGAPSGDLLVTQPVVEIRDSGGNKVNSSASVIAAVNNNGTLSGTLTVSATNGVATFTNLRLSGKVGTSYTLNFTSSSLTGSSNSVTVTVGAAAQLAITTQPVGGSSGGILATQPVLAVQDSGGNLVSTSILPVTASVSPSSGKLGGNSAVTAVAGVVSFSNLTLAGIAGTSYTIIFSATGLNAATSNSVVVTPGAATKLTINTQPSTTGTSGDVLSTQPVVQIQDAEGNIVTNSTAPVTAKVSPGGILGGTTTVNAVNGVATFTDLTLAGLKSTSYTIEFLSSPLGLICPTSSPLWITMAGAAVRLGIKTKPVAALSGSILSNQPVIEIRDSGGNLTASVAQVSVDIMSGAGGNLLGTTTVTASLGTATFTDLVLNGTVGVPYTLRFTSNLLTPAVSDAVYVTGVGPATQLVIITQPVAGASGALLTTQPVVAIRDAGNNTVTNVNSNISVAIALGGGGSIAGTQSITPINGIATFTNLSFIGSTSIDYVLQFASPGLASTNSNAIRVTGSGTASKLVIKTQPVGGNSGATLATQPVVEIQDAGGNIVSSSSLPVTVAMFSGTGGAVNGTTTVNATAGVTEFSNLSLIGKVSTNYVLRFSAPNLIPIDSANVTVAGAGAASQLAITTQPVGGASGAALATPPVVEVRDSGGNKVATSTASITASIQSGASGTLTGTLTVAATAGVATFNDLKLAGVVSNNYTIRFSSPGLISAISNNVGVTSGQPYQLAITTQPVGSASGSVLSTQPVVEIRDALGNRVTTSTDTVTVSISSGTGGVLSGTTAINAVGGVATFTNLVLTGTSGIDYQLQFASSGLIFATSSPIVISAGTATQIAITTQPTGGASGGLLLVQPKVEIRDAQGNRVINSSVAVTVAIGSGAGGTLSGTTTVSTAAGIATFTNLTLAGSTGTNYTLRFSTSALPSADSNNVTITPGAPARLAVSTQPTGAASGAQLTGQPVVLVRDAQNNTVTTSTAPVTVSIFSGGGVLGGTLTVNAVAGVATFNNLTLAGLISSSYVLRFTSPSLTTADSNSLNLSGHGTATQLILTTQPVPGPSGTPFTTQPALEIRDSGGNVVTNSTATVTATILSNPDGRGLLTGNAPVNATGGLVNFSGLALAGKIGTSYVVQFSSSGMTSANSNSLSVTGAGAASVLEIVSQPVAGASGTPLSSQPAVAVRDTGGNTITSSAVQVSVSIPPGTGGTLTGTTSINANSGVAVFSGLTLAGIVGTNYKFVFAASGLMSVTSDNVTVTPGTPGKLVITTNPVAGFSGGLMTTPAIVAIRDAQGNATGSSAPVSVSILTGSGGTLGGATTVNAINGIATFSNLTLAGTVGTNYVLRFTSTGTSSADSTVVTVTSGVPSRLALLTQPVGGISGQAMTTQPVVEIRDAQGNKVSGSTMPITASITVGGGGILGGQTTVSAVDGIATFNDLSLAGVIGTSYVIRFSTGAITSVSSSGVTVTGPGAPSQLVLTVQPVGGPSGAAMLTQPVITIRDSGGNTVTTSTASVTVELFSGTGGSLTGTKMINAINGQAAFTNLVLAGTINTNYVLQFTSTGLSPINSNNIRVTHGAATQLMVLTQPVGGGSGLTLAAQPVIGIVDAQNNIVTSSTAAVTVGIQSGSGGTLGGGALTVTASNGVATFAGVTLSGSVGTVYLLNFSSGSLTSVNSNNVTLIPGAATQLAIATAPVGGGSGALLSTQPVITLQDAQGNTSTSSATVSVAIQSGTGGTLGGTLSVVAVNGVATFTNLTLSGLVGTNYVLRFTSGALTRVDSGFVTVSVGAPTRLAITTQPVAGISGGLMTTPPVVEVRDSGNNLVPTATPEVTVEIIGQGGSLGGTTTVFAVNGVASFSGLTFAGALGTNYVLRFTSSGITFAGVSTGGVTVNSDNVAVTAVGAASKLAIKIPPVGGPSGSALLNQPVVVVQDPGGNTVNSIAKTVTVDLVSGTGLTGTKSVQTVAGEATFTNLVLAGLVSTNYALRFTADGLTSVDSPSFTLQPGQPTQLALVTPPVAGASGELMTTFPVVAIRDAQGNTVTSSTTAVTVEVFSGADGSLSGQTTVNAVNGVATFSNLRLAGKITNSYVLRFKSGSLSSVNSAGLTVTPGPAAQLEITAQPIAGVSGAPLATQPQVVIRDAQGNLINSSTATVTVALASNLSPGQISGTTTVTAASGVATFTNLAFAGLINTNYNFRFTSGSLTPVNSQQVIVTGVGPASQLVITTQPVGGASGAVLVTQPIVAIRDAGGNNLTENLPVTVEIGSGAGGQLTGVTTVNAQNGVANFSGLALAGSVGTNYVLKFTSSGLAAANSNAVTVGSGQATQLGITTQPVGGNSGAPFANPVVVVVRDAQGNTVGGASIPVTASIQSGSGGTVGGTFTVNAVNGVATFNNLTVSGLTNTPYVLRFSAGSLVVADSSPFTLQAGSAAQLAITTQPAAGPSGGFLGIQPVVEVRDSAGNKVSSSAPITVEIFSGLGGTLGGVKTVNAVNGVATFYDLTLAGKVGVNYGLRFSSGSLAAADSINVAVTGAGTPVRLVLTSQPVGAASGGVLAVQPVVAVQDLGGNTITSASGVVQVTINSGTGGSLGGVSSVNITGGVATFSNLTLAGTVGVPYSLRFSSAGLTPADSLNVLVTPGTPTQLWVTTHPLGGQSGQPLATAPVVVVRDAQGNTVTSSTAAITAALTSGAGATLSGQTTLNAVGGIATFSGLTVSGTVGTNLMLQFTSPGLAPVNSNSFTLTPGAISRLVLTTQPTGGPSGSALSVQPVVAIRDAQGNTVTSGAVTVTATILPGTGGTLSGQQTVTSVNGQAVFSSLALAGTAGTPYVIRFTAEGLTATDSGNVILTPGAATQLAITTQPTGGASGTNLNTQPVITIRDAQGNTVTNSTLPVSVTVGAGTGGTLGGTATVNAQSGVATFNGLTLAGLVGTSYTLRFAAPGLPSTDSTAVTVTPGLASKIAITTQPVGGPSGAVLSTQPVVTIQDAQGNTVTTSTVTVSVSLQSGTGGTLGGTTTVNAVGGVATFSGLTLAGAVGTSYVLRFSATGLSTIDSSFVTVAAGTATQLAVSTQPVGGQSGALLASQPVVTVRDSQGNPVLTSSTVVSVIISSGTGGSLGGTTTATTVNGVATFANLTLSGKVGTQYILKFSTAEFSVDSVALTVTPGQPTQLAIATAPVAGTSGAVFTAPPAISIRDAQSNLVTSSQVPVSVSILTGSGGTLGGSATVNAVNGIATFNNLTLSGPAGTSYILQFTSPGLAPISSSSITLAGGGTPTQMTLLAGNNQIATVGALLSTAPGVIVRDSSSNPVAGVSVVFAVASGGGTITGATQTTNSSGVATVGSWTLGTTAGTNTLTATVSGVTPITFTATGVAGPPSQLTINAGNNQSAQGGVAVAIKPSVIVRDANNNPVANVTVTFAVTLGGGTVTGATTVTSSTGIATVGSWTLGATAGINTLTASSSGLAPVTFTATSGTPPSINAVSGLVRTAGTISSNAAIAYISDSETPAANLTVTMTSPSLSGGVTISNLYNNNGTVTADISVNCVAAAGTGTFTLQVTDGSSTASATLSIGVTANTPPTLRYGSVGQTTPMISVNAGLSSSLAPSVPPSDNVVVNSVAAISKGTFTGNVLPDSNGLVSFTNAGPVGLHTITIRATDNCGAFTDATILIEVTNITTSSPMVASGDSVIGPGSTLTLRQTLTNSTAVPGNVTFVATIPGSITPINCTSDSEGACVISSAPATSAGVNISGVSRRFLLENIQNVQKVTWTGTIPANRSVTVSYVVQVGSNSVSGQYQITTTVNGTAGPSSTITVSAPQSGPGDAPAAISMPNQQKPASVLIYNLYSSSINTTTSDTSISLTNTNSASPVMVHLFFVDGTTGIVKDQFLTLTQNQTSTFLASDIDPEVTGYIIAVAVDSNGCPTIKNNLIGRADVWLPSGHYASLPAVGISGIMANPTACTAGSTSATLAFNGIQYDELPRTLAIDSLPSPANGNVSMLFANRIGGDLSGAALKIGPLSGLLFDDSETSRTFSISPGAAQMRGTLGDSLPRTQPRYSSVIPAGRTGWMKFWATGDEALSGVVINRALNGFSGGYNLQTLTTTSTATLTIPVIPVN